jgi:hypothetical protein
MNFDYLEASKSLGKDKLCEDYLDLEASYSSGWKKFIYEGCKVVEIWMNQEAKKMKIRGSIPYFIAGQNFQTSPQDFKNGIIHLSEVLNIDLMNADVNVFEFGTTLDIPFHTKEVFITHLRIQGMKTRIFDYGRYFEDRILKVKLYDAGKNIKDKLSRDERDKLTSNFGYNPSLNYLKVENHYKQPSISFKKRFISLEELLKPEFQTICKEDLLLKYKSIMKAKTIELKSKKQLNASTIPLILLKEYERLLPCKVEDLIKQRIKSFPSDIMTKDDKKSRKRQIMANIKKLDSARDCKYDLTELLQNKDFS